MTYYGLSLKDLTSVETYCDKRDVEGLRHRTGMPKYYISLNALVFLACHINFMILVTVTKSIPLYPENASRAS